jgi:vacuolar-type H+-ATPase subunit E/Vma4
MTFEERAAALEALVEGISQRLAALERRLDHQTSDEELGHDQMQKLATDLKTLEKQTPANSASREVMWRRIEELEGAPSKQMPPVLAEILRRLAAIEERLR